MLVFTSSQGYVFDNVSYGRRDVFVQARGRPLTRITDFPVPLAATDGYTYGATAMSRNGAYPMIQCSSTAATAQVEEGAYVYQRDQAFAASFD